MFLLGVFLYRRWDDIASCFSSYGYSEVCRFGMRHHIVCTTMSPSPSRCPDGTCQYILQILSSHFCKTELYLTTIVSCCAVQRANVWEKDGRSAETHKEDRVGSCFGSFIQNIGNYWSILDSVVDILYKDEILSSPTFKKGFKVQIYSLLHTIIWASSEQSPCPCFLYSV